MLYDKQISYMLVVSGLFHEGNVLYLIVFFYYIGAR